mmetsp:Transcript_49380/g.123814  ORF Transcript_49380/g.123814 Transcript_49380/m.123814 type:complete len:111 (-) Transcript_49380:2969-3301(-)
MSTSAGESEPFASLPSGVSYRIVTEGSGPSPNLDSTVKFDQIEWLDAFDSPNRGEDRGDEIRVSELSAEWEREAMTHMRVGEVRRIVLPPGMYFYDRPAFVELRLLAIVR